MSSLPSKTFCILPWIHLHPQPNGDVYQCCVAPHQHTCGSTTTHTLEEIWNNDYMTTVRKQMLSGVEANGCNRCYDLEKAGFQSSRNAFNKRFFHKIQDALATTDSNGVSSKFDLAYWDFRFSNICNFRCRMCGPALSSAWALDENLMYPAKKRREKIIHIDNYSINSIKKYVDQFIDTVEEVYFAGGEPLLMEEHYYILDTLIDHNRSDVYLRYNTNLSQLKFKSKSVIEYWSKFKHVDIYASLDALGPVAEYIRAGTDWKGIEENLVAIINSRTAHMGVSATPQIYNIFDIPELVERLIELNVDPNRILISNMLTHGEHFNIQTLPNSMKQEAETVLRNYQSICKYNNIKSQIDSIISFMNVAHPQSVELNSHLKHHTVLLDNLRKESYKCLNPRLVKWLDSL